MIGQQAHYPYGETWYASNTTSKFIFTSYERDPESSNDYAMARFYISRFGRFSCVDPVLGRPAYPQTWNRYVYARNDPVNIVDPSGTFGFLAFLIQLIFTFLNSLFFHTWFQGISGQHISFGLSPVPTFSLSSISATTPPTFPTGGGIDWHTLLPGNNPNNTKTPTFLDPGSDYYDPATGNGSGSGGASSDDFTQLRLVPGMDYQDINGRFIDYSVANVTGAPVKGNYSVTEHFRKGEIDPAFPTYPEANKFGDWLGIVWPGERVDTHQHFTISEGAPSATDPTVLIRRGGRDYSEQGVYRGPGVQDSFVNGLRAAMLAAPGTLCPNDTLGH